MGLLFNKIDITEYDHDGCDITENNSNRVVPQIALQNNIDQNKDCNLIKNIKRKRPLRVPNKSKLKRELPCTTIIRT